MKHNKIQLAHGGGGLLSNELIEKFFLPIIGNPILNKLFHNYLLFIIAVTILCESYLNILSIKYTNSFHKKTNF